MSKFLIGFSLLLAGCEANFEDTGAADASWATEKKSTGTGGTRAVKCDCTNLNGLPGYTSASGVCYSSDACSVANQ